MTLHAPRHGEWGNLFHLCHLIDAAVTRFAADALVDVNGMIEIDEIRKLRHASPWNRSPRGDAVPNRCHRRARHPERRVTADALLRRWQSSERAAVGPRVAVTTIDAERTRMQSMIEWNRLRDRAPFTACPRRTDPEHGERWYSDRYCDQSHERTSRDSSRAWREECRHQLSECEASRDVERRSRVH